jgi:serine/threonine-protein kinase
MTSKCDESRLKSFLDAELPEREHLELAGHLDTCAACRRTLERLAAGSGLWADLRHLARGPERPNRFAPGETGIFAPAMNGHEDADGRLPLEFLSPSDSPGSLGRLGPYEVTELLGSGGFGVVLKAVDTALGRTVAVKVLAPQLAGSAAARSRFAREAKAAAAVVHEHVVAIHAVASWNGLPYLVMPYVAGQSLQERVDQEGPLGVKEVLRIGMQTAQGLAAAHAQGLVHRDVKPSNILLENGVERVKLTDFGLARAIDDASLTQSGVLAGTPQYMSPEQAQGESIDHRSDLFSLGSVLYFACAGHSPFRASSTPAVLRRVCDERPRPLPEINPEIPTWLAEIIDRLQAKDPHARFQTAGELADVLGRRLANLQGAGAAMALTAAAKASSLAAPRRRVSRRAVAALVALIPVFALAVPALRERHRLLDTVIPAGGYFHAPRHESNGKPGFFLVQESTADDRVEGSGNAATKKWDISGFDRVQIRSAFQAEIAKGNDFTVTTTADDNVLPLIQVVKEGRTLKVGLAPRKQYWLRTKLKAQITLPTLVGMDLGGASTTVLKGFDSEKNLDLDLSGASKLEGGFVGHTARFKVGGASTVSLTGSARSARIVADGSSHLKLADYPLKECLLTLDGASTAQLAVSSEAPFKADLRGASRLRGSVKAPDLELRLEGASQARFSGSSRDAEIRLESASQLKLSEFNLDSAKLRLNADGASSATLHGRSELASLAASGASHLNLAGLVAKVAEVKLTGVSSATVEVKDRLSYDLSSASHLKYRGDPASVRGKKSGGSSIARSH